MQSSLRKVLAASSAAIYRVVPGPGKEVRADVTAIAIMIVDLLCRAEGVCLSLMVCFHAHILMLDNAGWQEVVGASETQQRPHSWARSRVFWDDRPRRSLLQTAFPRSSQT